MRDPELDGYVAAIEAHLGRRRGVDHVLTPGDFALARGWYEAGIPLADVTGAIDAVAATGRPPNGLAPCRRHVEGHRARAPRRVAGATSAESVGEGDSLAPVERWLASLAPPDRARFAAVADSLAELRAAGATSGEEAWARWEARLDRAAVEALPEREREAIRREAQRSAERQRGRVADDALEQARERLLVRRARERWGLPPPGRRGG